MADSKLRLRSGTGETVDLKLVDNGDGTYSLAMSAAGAGGLAADQLPETLGQKTASGSLGVVLASDQQVTLAAAASRSVAAITRPANTTAYTASDVVGGVLTFSSVTAVPGGPVMLTSCDLRYDAAAIPSGMTSFRLYLYSATPASAYADNAPWDLPSGDRAAFIGYVDLGAILDLGSTLFAQVDGVNKQVHCATGSTTLYGYLVTIGGYTPAANSETAQVALRGVSL